jgi:FkbM family methyltransferase
MKKLVTYFWYFIEYLKHRDLLSVFASVNYLLFKKSHSTDRIITSSIGRFFCRKNTNDFQFANYRYEWGVKKYILQHCDDYSLFIDGGACVGDYCILMAKKSLRCIAFEPVPSNFETLKRNIELNELTEAVQIFPLGLGAADSKANFIFNPVNTGASYKNDEGVSGGFVADIRTLDSMMEDMKIKSDERILLKLDVEGMEAEVFEGAASFIRSYQDLLIIFEDKHAGKELTIKELEKHAHFEYGIVDEFNMFARKVHINS